MKRLLRPIDERRAVLDTPTDAQITAALTEHAAEWRLVAHLERARGALRAGEHFAAAEYYDRAARAGSPLLPPGIDEVIGGAPELGRHRP